MQETQVRSLGQEDPLEKGMASHSSILLCVPLSQGPHFMISRMLEIMQTSSAYEWNLWIPFQSVVQPFRVILMTFLFWQRVAISYKFWLMATTSQRKQLSFVNTLRMYFVSWRVISWGDTFRKDPVWRRLDSVIKRKCAFAVCSWKASSFSL